jgi:hypothetical protein
MAFRQAVQKKKVEVYKTPSLYGSHASMEVSDDELTQEVRDWLSEHGEVALRDEKGVYTTEKKRLDTGLADPRRYSDRVTEDKN